MLTPKMMGAKGRRQGEVILENNKKEQQSNREKQKWGWGGVTHLFVHFNVKAIGHLVILKQIKDRLFQTDKAFDTHDTNAKAVRV